MFNIIIVKAERYKKVIIYKDGFPVRTHLYNTLEDLFAFLKANYSSDLMFENKKF